MKKTSEKILDEWLVSSAQLNDVGAFTRLIQRWQGKLLGYANTVLEDRELAKDVSQEALFQVSKSIKNLEDPASFPKWVYTIVHRRCTDALRAKIKHRERHVENGMEHINELAEFSSDRNETHTAIEQAFKLLATEEVQIVRLFYLEGFDIKEIAEIINRPSGTVKSKLFYARKKLSNLL